MVRARRTAAAPVDSSPFERAAIKTARAIWFTGLPTLLFVPTAAFIMYHEPQMRAAISIDAIEALFGRWVYYSYFSVCSILLYQIYNDYQSEFIRNKYVFGFYLLMAIPFVNNLILRLALDLRSIELGKSVDPSPLNISLSYALTVLAMFCYQTFRELDLAVKEAPPAQLEKLKAAAAHVLSHAAYWSIPLAVAAVLGTLLTWILQFDEPSKFAANAVFNTVALAGVIIPVYQRIRR